MNMNTYEDIIFNKIMTIGCHFKCAMPKRCNGYYKWEYTKCVLAKSKTEDKFIVLPKDNKFISMLYTEQELKQLIKDNAIIL